MPFLGKSVGTFWRCARIAPGNLEWDAAGGKNPGFSAVQKKSAWGRKIFDAVGASRHKHRACLTRSLKN
jgi:hypothetical protein